MPAASASRSGARVPFASICSATALAALRSPGPLASAEAVHSSATLPRRPSSGRSPPSRMTGSLSALPGRRAARRTAVSGSDSPSFLRGTSAGCCCPACCSSCWTCATSWCCGSSPRRPVSLAGERCRPCPCRRLPSSCPPESASAGLRRSLARTWWSAVPSRETCPG